jgi:hypothetical protein
MQKSVVVSLESLRMRDKNLTKSSRWRWKVQLGPEEEVLPGKTLHSTYLASLPAIIYTLSGDFDLPGILWQCRWGGGL